MERMSPHQLPPPPHPPPQHTLMAFTTYNYFALAQKFFAQGPPRVQNNLVRTALLQISMKYAGAYRRSLSPPPPPPPSKSVAMN
jgi:hypothetical protein